MDLAALHKIKSADPDLRAVALTPAGQHPADQMGGGWELLEATVNSAPAMTALTTVLVTWMRSRSRQGAVTVTVTGPHGSVTAHSADLDDPTSFIGAVGQVAGLG